MSLHQINHPDHDARLIWRIGMGRTAEILDITVHNDSRRQGTGTWLVQQLREQVPEETALIYAITRYDNTLAHQFYESMGFRIVGRLHNFYRDCPRNEHAFMYGLDL